MICPKIHLWEHGKLGKGFGNWVTEGRERKEGDEEGEIEESLSIKIASSEIKG